MTGSPDFWSRRKAGVAAEAKAETAEQEAGAAELERARLAQMSDDDMLAELNLSAPESLSRGDDFSAFMKGAVPERLKRRALRALWRTNPVLANVDGLVDYGGDFTDKATTVENLQTAYQVGKGMLAHLQSLSAPRTEDPVEIQDDGTPEDEPEQPPEPEDSGPAHLAWTPENQDEETVAPPAPRRMTFTYVGETG